MAKKKLKVLVVGCGHMGASHARAYRDLPGYEICGLVARTPERRSALAATVGNPPEFSDFDTALRDTQPDVVSINTYPDTHAEYAIKALKAGCHLFMEKPIAETVKDARKIVDMAQKTGRKLVIGYILRQHPSWIKFIQIARKLGKPLVMRMNLNQQSHGANWLTHKSLMNSLSPIVDCGVHYVDVMCQMTRSRPVRVSAIGARLSDELKEGMYNYGMLQVTFEDGSVGWYEAGWGPMMSTEAFFVKDVVGPKGSVTIAAASAKQDGKSDDVDSHTKTEALRVHHGKLNKDLSFAKPDELINLTDEPGHDELCKREQKYLLDAIQKDLDLTDHMEDAVNSLRIVLAADQAFKTGKTINL